MIRQNPSISSVASVLFLGSFRCRNKATYSWGPWNNPLVLGPLPSRIRLGANTWEWTMFQAQLWGQDVWIVSSKIGIDLTCITSLSCSTCIRFFHLVCFLYHYLSHFIIFCDLVLWFYLRDHLSWSFVPVDFRTMGVSQKLVWSLFDPAVCSLHYKMIPEDKPRLFPNHRPTPFQLPSMKCHEISAPLATCSGPPLVWVPVYVLLVFHRQDGAARWTNERNHMDFSGFHWTRGGQKNSEEKLPITWMW